MFEILNLLYLATTVASQALNIVALATTDIQKQDNVKVYALTMKQQAPLWSDKCLYDGVMVQYARDWEETQDATGAVMAAEPDKPIGYALILTKERCPGKEARAIFSTASKYFYPLFGRDYVIREGHRLDAIDYAGLKADLRPKWMPQVMKTIESESASNPAAQDFMAEMKRRERPAEVAEQASAL